jgi:hypothetical protein
MSNDSGDAANVDWPAVKDCLLEAAVALETFCKHSERLRPYDNVEEAKNTASRCRFLAAFGSDLISYSGARGELRDECAKLREENKRLLERNAEHEARYEALEARICDEGDHLMPHKEGMR